MLSSTLLALAASASTASAQAIMGFNVGSSGNQQMDFENSFAAAANLPGAPAPGFSSTRLYTMVQSGTAATPISAIPAAIASKTTLLLGLWASAGQTNFNNEITALKSAINQYGSAFADVVVGISVGSEDLYRITDTSTVINHDPNPGAQPKEIIDYIRQVREAIQGTVLSSKPVGHVDTHTAFLNASNSAVIDACDFLGMDTYPYFEGTVPNSIDNAYDLFFSAYAATIAVSKGKPVWVTETGWPYTGSTYGLAVASVQNAETYWKKVGCALFGKTNVWWYTQADGNTNPAFGVRGNSINNNPLYDLSCPNNAGSTTKTPAAPADKNVPAPTAPASAKTPVSGSAPGNVPIPAPAGTGVPKPYGSPSTGSGAPYPTGSSGTAGTSPTGTAGSGSSGSGVPMKQAGTGSRNAATGAGLASLIMLVALL